MEYKKFRNGGEDISLLGLGLMRLPKREEGKDDVHWEEAQKIVDLAYQNGVNYFDTAYFYHGGDSERFTGNALKKYPRESYYLATKMPTPLLEKPEDIQRLFNEQLERTGADYFDFYLCHCLNQKLFDNMERLGLYQFLEEKKREGIIRHIGFSFHDEYPVLDTIAAAHPWEFAQIQLNYLDWDLYHSKEQYEILEKHNIPAIIMEPVRGGRLADLGPEANAILQAAAPGRSIASWAMRYAAGFGNVFTILSGMSNPQQVADNCDTFSPLVPLNAAERKALASAITAYRKNATIGCTGCRYCVPCPLGVSIPELFSLYNECAFEGNMDTFKEKYAAFATDQNAALCVECGQCETACPQLLPIPALLKKLHNGEKLGAARKAY